jgi:hypothetical protein
MPPRSDAALREASGRLFFHNSHYAGRHAARRVGQVANLP